MARLEVPGYVVAKARPPESPLEMRDDSTKALMPELVMHSGEEHDATINRDV